MRTEEGEGGESEGLELTEWRRRRRRRRGEEMTEMAAAMAREQYGDIIPPHITEVTTVVEFCFKAYGP